MTTMMTIKELSATTGMSQYAIRQGIATGIYPAFRVSGNPKGKYLINYEAFMQTLDDIANGNIPNKGKQTDTETDTDTLIIKPYMRRIAE